MGRIIYPHLAQCRVSEIYLMESSSLLFPMPPKPMLVVDPKWLVGYLTLDDEEQHYRLVALEQNGPMIQVWLRLLTLFHDAVMTQRSDPLDGETASHADQLRLETFAVALGSAKGVLDSILVGYYAFAFMWIRHMLEAWVVLVYLDARPDQAIRWYDERLSDQGNKPPKDRSMHNEIRASPNSKKWLPFLERVIDDLGRMDKMAHPSEQPLNQSLSDFTPRIKTGANYNSVMAFQALHDGANAIRILLKVFSESVQMTEAWHAELEAVIAAHKAANTPPPGNDETAAP
jgi:hypothetical protein